MDDRKSPFAEKTAALLSFGRKFSGKEAGALVLTLAAVLGLWFFVAAGYRREATEEIRKNLVATNSYKAAELAGWLETQGMEALRLSRHANLREMVSAEISSPGSRRAPLAAWLNERLLDKQYASLACLSVKGAVLLATPGYAAGAEKRFAGFFERAAQTGTALVTDLYLDADGRPRMALLIPLSPVGAGGAKTVGVLVININPEVKFYPLLKGAPLFIKTAETMLVRKEGEDVLFLNELEYATGSALRLRRPLSETGGAASVGLSGRSGFFAGVDYRGIKVFSAISAVEGSDWVVVTKIDRETLLGPVKTSERMALAVLLLAAGILYGIVYALLRRRARAGEALIREGERRLAALFSNLPGAAYRSVNPRNWTMEFLSGGCLGLTGYRPEELLTGEAPSFHELIVPEDRERVRKRLQSVAGENNRYELSYSLRCKDGAIKTVWEQGLAVKGQDGNAAALEGFISDITPLRCAEAGLRVSEQIFREFMEHSPIYVFFKDENIRPVQLSRNYEALLGKPLRELLGRSMAELFPSDLAKSMVADDRRILKEGRETVVVEELNGRIYRTIKFPISLEGRPRYLAGYTIDITEQKQAEETLRRQVRLRELLLKISSAYIDMPLADMESRINASLGEIGEFLGAGRAYIFDYDFHLQAATNTYEWCREGIAPQIKELQALPLADIPDWDVAAHRRGETVFIRDSSALPPGTLREIFESGGIKSVLGVPVMNAGACEGFVGLDWVTRTHALAGDERNLLSVFGLMLSNLRRRRLAEETLRDSETKYRTLFSRAAEGILVADARTKRLLYGNPAAYRMLGYTEAELMELAVADIHPKEALPLALAAFEAQAREELETAELPCLRKDGTVFYASISTSKLDIAGRGCLLGLFTDITGRKQAERKIMETAAALQEAQKIGNMGSYSFNILSGVWESSPQLDRIFGIEGADFKKSFEGWAEIIHPEERAWMQKYVMAHVVAEKQNFDRQYRIVRINDRSERWVHGRGEVLLDAAGRASVLIGVIQDITEIKLAELERERLNRDLLAKKQEMENFLYITTHDLRSPLVNIQGFSQNLARFLEELRGKLGPAHIPQQEKDGLEKLAGEQMPGALNFVLESSSKMDALITALLKVARVGRLEMKPETLDMTALVKKVLVSLRYQLEEAGGEVTVHLLPSCKADPGAVSQLFTNLLDNAIKYRHKDRTLAISVTGEIKGNRAFYTVADNGAGIAEKDGHRIWDVFYHADSGAGKKGEGVGLPLVKRLIERNDGSVMMESREGEGSVFHIELPAAGEAEK